jgi:hypothetical protein
MMTERKYLTQTNCGNRNGDWDKLSEEIGRNYLLGSMRELRTEEKIEIINCQGNWCLRMIPFVSSKIIIE